jgi:hypothetical protein
MSAAKQSGWALALSDDTRRAGSQVPSAAFHDQRYYHGTVLLMLPFRLGLFQTAM